MNAHVVEVVMSMLRTSISLLCMKFVYPSAKNFDLQLIRMFLLICQIQRRLIDIRKKNYIVNIIVSSLLVINISSVIPLSKSDLILFNTQT